ncbi:unnamed protein product [Medioppia subpectinata]|uniref:Uncharacterized protein n=1 Tax=Medioppia subpectinata TaxID=1979941 RepID=A0A7R9PW52_9ACAR|nr:unnamed protein product [Medioppia subpectinata]CAG2102514.1 unnamed protein product [Medioppia subpectinata]
MRLTSICRSFRPEFVGYVPKFPGNVETGKHRFVPKVTTGKKLSLYKQLKHEEQVMRYISKPYITPSQEKAYLQSIGRTRPEYWDDFLRQPLEEPLKQYFAADYLRKLDFSRGFEEED